MGRGIPVTVALVIAALPLHAGLAQAGTNTVTFGTGEHAIVIPSGVTTLHVIAVGGSGGMGYMDTPGGRGARVEADLTVTPGAARYLLVGGNGQYLSTDSAAGGGGGASDIRTTPGSAGLSPDTRVLIAAGGGGGGQGFGFGLERTGGAGGDAGTAGQGSQNCAGCGVSGGGAAGIPAGTSAGGQGGGSAANPGPGVPGAAGTLGFGGDGAYLSFMTLPGAGGFNGGGGGGNGQFVQQMAGGGGGGGLNGGGGGGGVSRSNALNTADGGGGGGGGSNLVPAGGSATIDTTATPAITVSYSDTVAPVVGLNQPPAAVNTGFPTLTGTSGTVLGDGAVTVKLYAGALASGPVIRSQTASRNASTGAYSATLGPQLPDGQYTAQATQVDGGGNSAVSPARTFLIDATPPVVGLDQPPAASSLTPTLVGGSGTTTRDGAVTVTVYSGAAASGPPVRTIEAQRDAATGAYSASISPPLAEGQYTARATQVDTAGNTGASPARTFVVDATPPQPELTAPAAGLRTADATPSFTGTAGAAGGDGAGVVIAVYPGSTATGTPTATLDAAVSGTSFAVDAGAPLPDGTYTARVSQTDSAGNVGAGATRTFTIDTAGPVVTLATPGAGAVVGAAPTFAGKGGTAPGDGSEITVKVYLGSTPSGPAQTLTATRDPVTGSYSVAAALPLADGTWTVQASQADDLGNAGKSAAVTFRVGKLAAALDRAAPVLSKVSLSPSSFRRGSKGTTVRYTLGEAGTVSIAITRKGRKVILGTLSNKARVGANSRRFDGRVKRKRLAVGSYVMTIRATDAAGNRSAPKRISFRIRR